MSDYVDSTEDLINLLCEFRGTVALSGDSLGRTDVLKHSIALQECSTPFYVPNYRLPVSRCQLADNFISDYEEGWCCV